MNFPEFNICLTYARNDVTCFQDRFYVCTPLDSVFITKPRWFGFRPMEIHRIQGEYITGQIPKDNENWTEIEFVECT